MIKRLKDKVLNNKHLKKVTSITLASMLMLNSISSGINVFAQEIQPRSLTVKQEGGKLSYVGDRHGNKLTFPVLRASNGELAYCMEHHKPTPTPNGVTYTESRELDSGLSYILNYNPNTGDSNKDYYIKGAALKHYLGQINWIQYATTGTDVRDRIVALSNEARSKGAKSNLSITANPRHQDFRQVGDFYETDWYNVSIQGDLTSYRMDIKGQPNGTQIINKHGQVVDRLNKDDDKFKLRVPKENVTGNFDIKIRLSGEFIDKRAVEYIPSNSTYQKIALLRKLPINAQDIDILTAKLVGHGALEIIKKSEDGRVLQGAGFKLVRNSADATGVQDTDGNGRTTFSNLSPGDYEVVETKAPHGHVSNGSNQMGTVNPGQTSTIEVSNEIIKGRVKILKVDEETNQPLGGAEFELVNRGNGAVAERLVTGNDGTVTSGLHHFGDYLIREVKAPDRYTLNGQEHFVTINNHMQTVELTVRNRIIKGRIGVNKSDSDIKGLKLEGIEFEITNEVGHVVDTLVTDNNGYAESKLLNYGKYFLKETKTLPTYILNTNVYEVDITEDGKVYTYDIENDVIKGKIQIVKNDKENTEVPVAGAIFDVIADNVLGVNHGTVVETITSDKDGFAYTKDLRAGRYKIVETFAPEGYWQSDKEYFVDVTEHGKVYVRYISNDSIQAKLRVLKTDGNTKQPLENAKFKIVDRNTGKDVEFTEFVGIIPVKKTIFTTNKNGEFVTQQVLKYGNYQLVEVEAPQGYNLLEPIDFNIDKDMNLEEIELLGKVTTKEVENTRITGNMELLKIDRDTKEPLEGVEFKVTCLDGFMKGNTWNLKSNKDGIVSLLDLEYGKYRIEEVKTIEGYVLNTNPINFEIKEHGKTIKLEMTNKMIRGNVELVKVDSEKLFDLPLKGAEFTIYNKDGKEVDKITTNIFGYAKSKDLLYGKYTMKETKAPHGYKPSNAVYEININTDGQIVKFDIENNIKKGKIEVIKLDSELKKDLPLKGAEFTIWDRHKNVVDTLVTNVNGYAVSKDIIYGKYTMKETKAPQGYLPSDKVYQVEVTEDGKVYTYEIENTIKKGKIEVIKLDSELKKDLPIAGAEFTIWDRHRNEIDKLVTGQDGKAISKEIRYGKYTMKETKAPQGYLPSDKVYQVEVTEDGKVYTYEIENTIKKGKVEVIKLDSANKRKLVGAEFTIWDRHRNVVDTLLTDEKGYAISKEIRYGKYVMQETKAPQGYLSSDKVYQIEITEDGKVYTYEVENEIQKGDLEFSKTDVSTGEIVEGAKIEITGKSETNDYIKFDFISSKDDKFKLPIGKYEFKETIAPKGYVLSEEIGTFEIKENGEVVKAELKNKRIEGILEFSKTDVSTGEVIEGAEIKIECVEGFEKGKVIEFTSSKEGNKFSIKYGKYRITETTAPKGYIKTDEVGEFEITEDGQIVKAELKNKRIEITTTKSENKLSNNPKTGDIGIVGISVLAVSSLSGLLYLNLKNRKDEE